MLTRLGFAIRLFTIFILKSLTSVYSYGLLKKASSSTKSRDWVCGFFLSSPYCKIDSRINQLSHIVMDIRGGKLLIHACHEYVSIH
jgi:hypothetical protein